MSSGRETSAEYVLPTDLDDPERRQVRRRPLHVEQPLARRARRAQALDQRDQGDLRGVALAVEHRLARRTARRWPRRTGRRPADRRARPRPSAPSRARAARRYAAADVAVDPALPAGTGRRRRRRPPRRPCRPGSRSRARSDAATARPAGRRAAARRGGPGRTSTSGRPASPTASGRARAGTPPAACPGARSAPMPTRSSAGSKPRRIAERPARRRRLDGHDPDRSEARSAGAGPYDRGMGAKTASPRRPASTSRRGCPQLAPDAHRDRSSARRCTARSTASARCRRPPRPPTSSSREQKGDVEARDPRGHREPRPLRRRPGLPHQRRRRVTAMRHDPGQHHRPGADPVPDGRRHRPPARLRPRRPTGAQRDPRLPARRGPGRRPGQEDASSRRRRWRWPPRRCTTRELDAVICRRGRLRPDHQGRRQAARDHGRPPGAGRRRRRRHGRRRLRHLADRPLRRPRAPARAPGGRPPAARGRRGCSAAGARVRSRQRYVGRR